MNRALAALAAATVALAVASSARADTPKKACTSAYAQAQTLRDAHKLLEAREQLRACARPVCTAFIVKDCTTWLEEVESSLPTLVFTAKNGAGHDLLDVRVAVDGRPLVYKLDGQSVAVDPGPHSFRFEQADGTSATREVLVREGEKNVGVAVVLPSPGATPTAPAVVSAPPPAPAPFAAPPPGGGPGPRKIVGLAIGAVGIAGLAAGAVTGILASSAWDTAQNECPSHTGCSSAAQRDHDQAAGLANASTVALVAGGVLTALGLTLFLTAPKADKPSVGLLAAPGALGFAGRF